MRKTTADEYICPAQSCVRRYSGLRSKDCLRQHLQEFAVKCETHREHLQRSFPMAKAAIAGAFYCKQCSKSFTRRSTMKRHEQTHLPCDLTCSLCPHSCNQRRLLNQHMLKKHRMKATSQGRSRNIRSSADRNNKLDNIPELIVTRLGFRRHLSSSPKLCATDKIDLSQSSPDTSHLLGKAPAALANSSDGVEDGTLEKYSNIETRFGPATEDILLHSHEHLLDFELDWNSTFNVPLDHVGQVCNGMMAETNMSNTPNELLGHSSVLEFNMNNFCIHQPTQYSPLSSSNSLFHLDSLTARNQLVNVNAIPEIIHFQDLGEESQLLPISFDWDHRFNFFCPN